MKINMRGWCHLNEEMVYSNQDNNFRFEVSPKGIKLCTSLESLGGTKVFKSEDVMLDSEVKSLNGKGESIFVSDIVMVSGLGLCIAEISPTQGLVFKQPNCGTIWTAEELIMEGDLGEILGNVFENKELLK